MTQADLADATKVIQKVIRSLSTEISVLHREFNNKTVSSKRHDEVGNEIQ